MANIKPAEVSKILKQQLEGVQTGVELEENIDSALIGGFILRVDDNYIDASVRNKLRKIKKELVGSAMI